MIVEWINLLDLIQFLHVHISQSLLSLSEMLVTAVTLLLAESYLVIIGSWKHPQIKRGLVVVKAEHAPTHSVTERRCKGHLLPIITVIWSEMGLGPPFRRKECSNSFEIEKKLMGAPLALLIYWNYTVDFTLKFQGVLLTGLKEMLYEYVHFQLVS